MKKAYVKKKSVCFEEVIEKKIFVKSKKKVEMILRESKKLLVLSIFVSFIRGKSEKSIRKEEIRML
ncbi:hypothetical protein [Metabacillus schmidteae]|uniref:hypothetical protein n=1 Tax=Metabacillus schmidteae TaxID=2730405 RepID=UPI00158D52D1|nr:hypothetical protein [Metabacillus schmidteae]